MEDFFVHHWPGQPIPVPPVSVVHFEKPESANAGSIYRDFTAHGREKIELPDEFYLRELFDLDLNDALAIWRFCEEFGYLGQVIYVPDYPWDDVEYAYLEISGRFGFVHKAQVLRNCVRIWDALQGGLSVNDVRRLWEGPLGLLAIDDEDFYFTEGEAALSKRLTELETELPNHLPETLLASYLVKTLNDGLRAFPVHLSVESAGQGRITDAQSVALWSALCLQFANHVAENARYSICQNESCRRKFVRQRGRAKKGQHRTVGVDFCSRQCAWAQGQRELRRRKKSERNREEGKQP